MSERERCMTLFVEFLLLEPAARIRRQRKKLVVCFFFISSSRCASIWLYLLLYYTHIGPEAINQYNKIKDHYAFKPRKITIKSIFFVVYFSFNFPLSLFLSFTLFTHFFLFVSICKTRKIR